MEPEFSIRLSSIVYLTELSGTHIATFSKCPGMGAPAEGLGSDYEWYSDLAIYQL